MARCTLTIRTSLAAKHINMALLGEYSYLGHGGSAVSGCQQYGDPGYWHQATHTSYPYRHFQQPLRHELISPVN
jgi:hypothetical protein